MASRPVILVVDDDPNTRAFLDQVLWQAGYDVEAVADGESALERIQAGGIDLVLLDRVLPGMDGVEVCRQARALGYDLPIVMLTAMVGQASRRASFTQGAHDYLDKPIDLDELLRCVDLWLTGPRTTS
jgi:DNA-binding response OmpR family regulator